MKISALVGLVTIGSGSLVGKSKISSQDYLAIAGYLDTNPLYCGIRGSHLDLSRITAVQGMQASQCGTCLRVTACDKSIYVMAVDRGGAGLDLNTVSFRGLFGVDSGLFEAAWEPAEPSNCTGIVKGGDYSLPGAK